MAGVRRIADPPALLRRLVEPASLQVVPRPGPLPGPQLQPVILHRLFHDLGELGPPVGLLLRPRVARRHLQAHLPGEDLDRLHEADVLGLAHEADRIALRMAAEAVVEALLVVDVERGGLFLVERARRPHVALALVRLAAVPHDLATRHLGHGQAVAQFIKETRGQTHGASIRLAPRRVEWSGHRQRRGLDQFLHHETGRDILQLDPLDECLVQCVVIFHVTHLGMDQVIKLA